ncbi:hypothetical protein L873DRAFT_1787630 [Choiromyces venosus 120613-1]|uniref:Uncharacterized protein n=1 Tax=Choiromyces venosus 120613-1 TaxID=1336337 RepID=A0A3N4JZG5_9PEZI|nr:hypothetical protein L873DRAFT_1787630 [Choiromyces venosus 120613-1]
MTEPRYNLRRTPAPALGTSRRAETSKLAGQGNPPKTAPARGAQKMSKEQEAYARRATEEPQKAQELKSALKRDTRAYRAWKFRQELSSQNSLNGLSDSELASGSEEEEEEYYDDGSSEGCSSSEEEEEEEEEDEPLFSAARDAILDITPTIIKDVLTLSSSAKDAMVRLQREGSRLGSMIIGSKESKKAAPKRKNADHISVDINVKGSPIPRGSSEDGDSAPVKTVRDRSGYRDGFGGARWEEVEPVRRNLSEDLSAAKAIPETRGRRSKTKHKRTAEEIAAMRSSFIQAVLFWFIVYLAYSNKRVSQSLYDTFDSIIDHPVTQDILGSATSALHAAVTPFTETGIKLFTPREVLLESRVRTSSAAAAAASHGLEKIIHASEVFNNLTRPIVIGLIAGELAAGSYAHSRWTEKNMRASIQDLSTAFEDAYEDLRVLTEAFKATIHRVHERYFRLAIILWDQAPAEMLPGLRLGGRNRRMLKVRGQRNKYSGFTVQGKYKIATSAFLREFNALRTHSRKALKSATAAMGKTEEVRHPRLMIIEKVIEIGEPLVEGLQALDKEVYRLFSMFLHEKFAVEDYARWVVLDEEFLKGKLEALFAALGRLKGAQRLRGTSQEG